METVCILHLAYYIYGGEGSVENKINYSHLCNQNTRGAFDVEYSIGKGLQNTFLLCVF